jgi:hypothetical protein
MGVLMRVLHAAHEFPSSQICAPPTFSARVYVRIYALVSSRDPVDMEALA